MLAKASISSIPAVGYIFRRAKQPDVALPAPVNVTPRSVASQEAGSAA
jgi:hypothetical protein